MNTSDILNRAADLIEKRGWHQGDYVNDCGGLCLDAALLAAVGIEPQPLRSSTDWPGYDPDRFAAEERAYTWLDQWMGRPETPISWNDAKRRTKEEVVAKLREAAEAARAEQ